MSNAQVQTGMRHWSRAHFPQGIERLHALYALRLAELAAEELNGQVLIEAAKHVQNMFVYRHPCTECSMDGYPWSRGLVFKVLRSGDLVIGHAAIMFPRARDAARQHGTPTDRSVAAYCNGAVSEDEVGQLVVRYHNALLSTIGVAAV